MSEHQLRASWEEAMVHSICWQVQIRFPPTFRNISPVLLTTIASHIFHPNTVTSTNQVPSYFSKNLSVFFRQELMDTWVTCRLQWSFPSRYWQLQIMSPPTFMLSMQLMKTHIFSQRIWIFNFVALKSWYTPHSNLHSIYWQLQISPLLLLPQLHRSLFRLLILWSKWAQVSVGQNEKSFFLLHDDIAPLLWITSYNSNKIRTFFHFLCWLKVSKVAVLFVLSVQ